MLSVVLAAADKIPTPTIDYHAIAPEIVVVGTLLVVFALDLIFERRARTLLAQIAGIGVLGALIPIITLSTRGSDVRSMFGGAYIVDDFSLVLKAFFVVVTYLTILLASDYIADGDYHEGEFYFLVLTALVGMMVMPSARDLISIFVALETISIPTYLLAGWRKHDAKSNESMLKYYIFGVLSSAVMLYGMSLVYGTSKSTLLTDIAKGSASLGGDMKTVFNVGILLTLVGFAFKVSAVPFHFWTPDTYEGAPTPVTAYLSVASKAGGFAAIFTLIYVGFFDHDSAWKPLMWIFAAASMTVGNMIATRQTNIVRMLAYSSIAQAGFMLVPFAVAADAPGARSQAIEATVVYILIYGLMNLGAFAAVIAIARRTRSGEIESLAGLFSYAPVLALAFSGFLFSLAGIPPFGGWFAKFEIFRAAAKAGTTSAYVLGAVVAVNTVIAFAYYGNVVRTMFFKEPAASGDRSPIRVPAALTAAMVLTMGGVLLGVFPQLFARLGEAATF